MRLNNSNLKNQILINEEDSEIFVGIEFKIDWLKIKLKVSLECSGELQRGQPLPGILDLRQARVSVFPEGEEFLVMLYGFGWGRVGDIFSWNSQGN